MGGWRVDVGGGGGDVAAEHDQRGSVVLGHGGAQGRFHAIEVLGGLAEVDHVPAVGAEPDRGVVGERQFGRAIDRDVVVVVDGDEAPQAEVPGE